MERLLWVEYLIMLISCTKMNSRFNVVKRVNIHQGYLLTKTQLITRKVPWITIMIQQY